MTSWIEKVRPWQWFTLRLASVVVLPVLWLAYFLGVAWLMAHVHLVVLVLLTVPLLGVLAVLLTGTMMLFITDAWGIPGHAAWVVAVFALFGGASTVGQTAESWILRWQGAETTCTVLDEQQRADSSYGTREGLPVTVYDYQLQCEAPDAPGGLTTPERISGERVQVRFDPSDAEYAMTVSEIEQSALVTWVVGICFGLWTLLSLTLVLLGMPIKGSLKAWPY